MKINNACTSQAFIPDINLDKVRFSGLFLVDRHCSINFFFIIQIFYVLCMYIYIYKEIANVEIKLLNTRKFYMGLLPMKHLFICIFNARLISMFSGYLSMLLNTVRCLSYFLLTCSELSERQP